MPKNKHLNIEDLQLDLNNYRTIPQKTEEDAINAMMAIKPERFYAVIESLIDDGYFPTENLIILEDNGFTVREGNRRTAALKLIHGIYQADNFSIPDSLKKRIDEIGEEWIKDNKNLPCIIYSTKEKDKVDRIVNLTHAKGEKASRDPWTSVARARQNRDEKNGLEPSLDMLEKYLENGKNHTNQQKERWSGDYPLTVLEEALKTIINRIGYNSIGDLVKAYPKIKNRNDIEDLIRDIGLKVFGFPEIRSKEVDFAASYNIAPQNPSSNTSKANTSSSNKKSNKSSNKPKAYGINDQRSVTQILNKFNPKGNDRQKLVALRDELKKLKVKNNPIAFCFVLRSMFEISSLIYSKENNLPISKLKNGKNIPNTLKQQLSEVTKHLTSNNSNLGMVKNLHGANSELSKSEGLLSVTSMNQLVHHPSFSIASNDIFTLFNNIYPLLEAMN